MHTRVSPHHQFRYRHESSLHFSMRDRGLNVPFFLGLESLRTYHDLLSLSFPIRARERMLTASCIDAVRRHPRFVAG